jgi:hypothetical protein
MQHRIFQFCNSVTSCLPGPTFLQGPCRQHSVNLTPVKVRNEIFTLSQNKWQKCFLGRVFYHSHFLRGSTILIIIRQAT